MKLFGVVFLALILLLAGCTTTGTGTAPEDTEAAAAESESGYSFGFEDGTLGDWAPKGPVKIEVAEGTAHSGKYSLYASGRKENWHSPEMNVTDLTEKKGSYGVTVWLLVPEDSLGCQAKLTVETAKGEAKNWLQICNPIEIFPGEWTEITGEFTRKGPLDKAMLYIEPLDPSVNFYIDDIEITFTPEG